MNHNLLAIVVALLAALLSGCVGYHARGKDGTEVWGYSLLTDKGIAEANVNGLGNIRGYSSSPNVEAMRAFGEGLGAGIRAAAMAKP